MYSEHPTANCSIVTYVVYVCVTMTTQDYLTKVVIYPPHNVLHYLRKLFVIETTDS